MKVKPLSKSPDKISFLIEEAAPSLINSLRRIMMNKVPTMAIEDVEFKDNSSILYDESIAHRLGLIVLKSDIRSYSLPEKCSCKGEGCAKCELKLTLKAKGPKIVYASDLKSKDPKIRPVYPKTPIVKLLEDQEIQLVATAKLGVGKDHAKWSPGLVTFSYNPTITVNNQSRNFEKFKDKYPLQVFNKKGQIDKSLITTHILVDACDGICDDIVKVEYSDKDFIFNVESWGQLTPKEIVKKGIEVFEEHLNELIEKTDQLPS